MGLGLLKQTVRTDRGRLLAGGAIMAGLGTMVAGWIGVSGTPYPTSQLPYLIAAGAGSLALLGLGTTALLAADLHDEWTKLNQIEQELAWRGNGAGRHTTPSRSTRAGAPEEEVGR